jgi:hypothetical protein
MDVGFIFPGVSIMARVYTQDELDNAVETAVEAAVEAAVTKERARAAAVERLYRDMLEKRDQEAMLARSQLNQAMALLSREQQLSASLRLVHTCFASAGRGGMQTCATQFRTTLAHHH